MFNRSPGIRKFGALSTYTILDLINWPKHIASCCCSLPLCLCSPSDRLSPPSPVQTTPIIHSSWPVSSPPIQPAAIARPMPLPGIRSAVDGASYAANFAICPPNRPVPDRACATGHTQHDGRWTRCAAKSDKARRISTAMAGRADQQVVRLKVCYVEFKCISYYKSYACQMQFV